MYRHFAQRNGEHLEGFDQVIWAVGRRPNTDDMNLPAAGMDLSANGVIPIADLQNTNTEGIYSLGDITGRSPLTPVAVTAGLRLADRLFGGQVPARLEDSTLPVYPAECIPRRTANPHEFSLANACKQLLHGGCGYSSTPTG